MEKATQLAANGPEPEKAYIAALTKRFTRDPNPDGKRLGRAYADAMGEVSRRFPDDLDAATLYADSLMNLNPWQLWTKDGKAAPGTEEIVSILEATLKRDPDHLGANHLYIHAVEASRQPERALPSAARLGRLAPAAGHIVHMPGHIYLRTGDYHESAKSNEAAVEADRRYIEQTGMRGMYAAMYYSHNIHFLVESYGRMGNYRQALGAAKRLGDHVRGYIKEMPMVEGFLPSPYFTMLRFARWDEILQTPDPGKEHLLTNTLWHFARGVALTGNRQIEAAEKERTVFLLAAKNLPGETPFGLNSAASVLLIGEHVLAARLAWARGEKTVAIDEWKKAVAAQDALNYDEPPGWYYPVRESLGAALLMNAQATEAEDVFRADLRDNPRNGRSLFGLLESLKAQRKEGVPLVEREFERAWKNADTKLKIEDF
jgi:tetratricopeptide (TPR) repeat protein